MSCVVAHDLSLGAYRPYPHKTLLPQRRKRKRERKNQIVVMLSDKEYNRFKRSIKKAGLTNAQYIRRLIMNRQIKENAPTEYGQMVFHMAKIGNSMNQIARKASEANNAALDDAKHALTLMNKCYDLVKGLE